MKRKQGFTMIEVMAACFILMIAVEILSVGMSYAFRVKSNYEILLKKGTEAEERFLDKTEWHPGMVYLLDEDEVIWEEMGWLYGQEADNDTNMELAYILVDEVFGDCEQEDMP